MPAPRDAELDKLADAIGVLTPEDRKILIHELTRTIAWVLSKARQPPHDPPT